MEGEASIAVTGLGVVSPLGETPQDFWEKALVGESAISKLTRFDTSALSTRRGAEIDVEDGDLLGANRPGSTLAVEWASRAAGMAVDQAGLETSGLAVERAGVCFGTVMGTRSGIEPWLLGGDTPPCDGRVDEVAWRSPPQLSRAAAKKLGFGGPNCVIATACAAGNSAIAYGAEALRAGQADAMVVGGVDEISQATLLVFDSFRALASDCVRPFDANRRGLMLGEAAAALVLEREEDAWARRATIFGRVLGYANVGDAHHMTAPHPEGIGAARAMELALAEAGIMASDVDHVSAHGTGTPANDAVEALAIRRVFGSHADRVPVTALKSMLGHSQGGASAIEAVGCLLTIRDGLIPATANYETPDPDCDLDVVAGEPRHALVRVALSNAFGFGGNIECVVFGAP